MKTLVSTTDRENRAMRAAFARAGYVEFAAQRDFRWSAAPPDIRQSASRVSSSRRRPV